MSPKNAAAAAAAAAAPAASGSAAAPSPKRARLAAPQQEAKEAVARAAGVRKHSAKSLARAAEQRDVKKRQREAQLERELSYVDMYQRLYDEYSTPAFDAAGKRLMTKPRKLDNGSV